MYTATEKFNKKYTEVVETIEKNFTDLKTGEKMLISCPRSITNYIVKNTLWNRKICDVNAT